MNVEEGRERRRGRSMRIAIPFSSKLTNKWHKGTSSALSSGNENLTTVTGRGVKERSHELIGEQSKRRGKSLSSNGPKDEAKDAITRF